MPFTTVENSSFGKFIAQLQPRLEKMQQVRYRNQDKSVEKIYSDAQLDTILKLIVSIKEVLSYYSEGRVPAWYQLLVIPNKLMKIYDTSSIFFTTEHLAYTRISERLKTIDFQTFINSHSRSSRSTTVRIDSGSIPDETMPKAQSDPLKEALKDLIRKILQEQNFAIEKIPKSSYSLTVFSKKIDKIINDFDLSTVYKNGKIDSELLKEKLLHVIRSHLTLYNGEIDLYPPFEYIIIDADLYQLTVEILAWLAKAPLEIQKILSFLNPEALCLNIGPDSSIGKALTKAGYKPFQLEAHSKHYKLSIGKWQHEGNPDNFMPIICNFLYGCLNTYFRNYSDTPHVRSKVAEAELVQALVTAECDKLASLASMQIPADLPLVEDQTSGFNEKLQALNTLLLEVEAYQSRDYQRITIRQLLTQHPTLKTHLDTTYTNRPLPDLLIAPHQTTREFTTIPIQEQLAKAVEAATSGLAKTKQALQAQKEKILKAQSEQEMELWQKKASEEAQKKQLEKAQAEEELTKLTASSNPEDIEKLWFEKGKMLADSAKKQEDCVAKLASLRQQFKDNQHLLQVLQTESLTIQPLTLIPEILHLYDTLKAPFTPTLSRKERGISPISVIGEGDSHFRQDQISSIKGAQALQQWLEKFIHEQDRLDAELDAYSSKNTDAIIDALTAALDYLDSPLASSKMWVLARTKNFAFATLDELPALQKLNLGQKVTSGFDKLLILLNDSRLHASNQSFRQAKSKPTKKALETIQAELIIAIQNKLASHQKMKKEQSNAKLRKQTYANLKPKLLKIYKLIQGLTTSLDKAEQLKQQQQLLTEQQAKLEHSIQQKEAALREEITTNAQLGQEIAVLQQIATLLKQWENLKKTIEQDIESLLETPPVEFYEKEPEVHQQIGLALKEQEELERLSLKLDSTLKGLPHTTCYRTNAQIISALLTNSKTRILKATHAIYTRKRDDLLQTKLTELTTILDIHRKQAEAIRFTEQRETHEKNLKTLATIHEALQQFPNEEFRKLQATLTTMHPHWQRIEELCNAYASLQALLTTKQQINVQLGQRIEQRKLLVKETCKTLDQYLLERGKKYAYKDQWLSADAQKRQTFVSELKAKLTTYETTGESQAIFEVNPQAFGGFTLRSHLHQLIFEVKELDQAVPQDDQVIIDPLAENLEPTHQAALRTLDNLTHGEQTAFVECIKQLYAKISELEDAAKQDPDIDGFHQTTALELATKLRTCVDQFVIRQSGQKITLKAISEFQTHFDHLLHSKDHIMTKQAWWTPFVKSLHKLVMRLSNVLGLELPEFESFNNWFIFFGPQAPIKQKTNEIDQTLATLKVDADGKDMEMKETKITHNIAITSY